MVRIKLQRWVSEESFEELIAKHYSSSLSGVDLVEFNFADTEWCDLLALSLLTLWILELSERRVPIRILAPQNRSVTEFLRNYQFLRLLHQHGVEHNFSFDLASVRTRTTQTSNVATIPLTLLDQNGFDRLIADLQSPRRLDVVLRDMAHTDVVKSGAIRDVVLGEIGSNFFDHAKGRFAHILLTAYRAIPNELRGRRVERQVRFAQLAQQEFFRALNGEPYIVFSLSDMGPGIPGTIGAAYQRSHPVTDGEAPSEADLLRYAFEYNSTSRTLAERIGSIERILKAHDGPKAVPPPTGLYQLRTVMREFKGMLVVKSRGSWLVEDFLSNQGKAFGLRDPKSAEFGGTQYKLVFPFNVARARRFFANQFSNEGRLACVQLTPPSDHLGPNDVSAIQVVFEQMYRTIETALVAARKRREALLVDAKGLEVLPGKYQFYLLVKLMEQEPPHQYTIIVNAPASLPVVLPTTSTTTHPLLVFDENWSPRALGLSEADQTSFSDLLREAPLTDESREFAKRLPHWFRFERLERGSIQRYLLRLSEPLLKESLKAAYADQLRGALLEESNGYYFRSQKVLLPSKQYCDGYFDIAKFLGDSRLTYMLQSWVAYTCQKIGPRFVITVGENAHAMAALVNDFVSTPLETVHIPTPIHLSKLFEASRAVAEDSAVIVTDVVGTASSLKNVLRSLQRAKILSTLAVVNATGEQAVISEGKAYSIQAIVAHRLTFAQGLPIDWDYDDVAQVDPETHALIPKVGGSSGGLVASALWERGQLIELAATQPGPLLRGNRFLEEAIIPSGAILEGHFASEHSHMMHLFNIPKLLQALGDEVAQRIYTDAAEYLRAIVQQYDIENIAFPEYNVGLEDLAMRLSAKFSGSLPVALSRHILEKQLSPAVTLGKAVIFLDDAMYSGNTVFEMLDLAEDSQVKHILVYTIVRRGDQRSTNRVRKIGRYGRSMVAVREVSTVELPVYRPNTCPICQHREAIREIFEFLDKSSPLRVEAQNDLSRTAPVSPQVACKEDVPGLPDSQQRMEDRVRLRWMLSCAYESVKFGHELAEIVRTYEANPALTLDFFLAVARERGEFLQRKAIREKIFYPTFVDAIRRAARAFILRITELTYDEAEGVLAVLAAFDPFEFLERLPVALNQSIDNPRVGWLLLRECYLTPEIRGWPERVLQSLSNARQLAKGVASHPADDFIPFWQHVKETSEKLDGTGALESFQRLTGRKVHDLTKYIDKIANDIESQSQLLAPDWSTVGEALAAYIGDLSRFRRSLAECTASTTLWERIQEFEVNFASVAEIVRHITTTGRPIEPEMKTALLERLRRMHELIDASDGICNLLEEFRPNILDSLQEAISRFKSSIEHIDWDVPDRAPLVFGHQFEVFIALMNLIDNACKAGTSCLRVHVRLIGDQTVTLHLLDKGKGIGRDAAAHFGQEIVCAIASRYAGSFELLPVSTDDPLSSDGYKTLAALHLPFVPESRSVGGYL